MFKIYISPDYVSRSPFLSSLGFDSDGFISIYDLSFDDLERVMCWPYVLISDDEIYPPFSSSDTWCGASKAEWTELYDFASGGDA